jgi:hypothetical protein
MKSPTQKLLPKNGKISLIGLFTIAILAAGLFLTNYTSGLSFVSGIILFTISWFLIKISRKSIQDKAFRRKVAVISGILSVIFFVFVIGTVFFLRTREYEPFSSISLPSGGGGGGFPTIELQVQPIINYDSNLVDLNITEYQAILKPQDSSLTNFEMQELVSFNYETQYDLNDEKYRLDIATTLVVLLRWNDKTEKYFGNILNSVARLEESYNTSADKLSQAVAAQELTLEEAQNRIDQLNTQIRQQIAQQALPALNKAIELEFNQVFASEELGFATRKISAVPLLKFYKPSRLIKTPAASEIKIIDLPQGAFNTAKDTSSSNITESSFHDEMMVEWMTDDIENEIVFSVYSPPYHYFRLLLSPFAGITSLGPGFLVLLGTVVSGFIADILKPALVDIVKDWIKSRFNRTKQT